jgi:hypothetical protein
MFEAQVHNLDAAANARCVDEIYDRLERTRELLRVDPHIRPDMFHQATISPGELTLLRQVRNVIRGKHVRRIDAHKVVFDKGEMPAERRTLYVDCSARSISWGPTKPVFDGPRITLQFVRDGRFSLSAAAIGYVEATIHEERRKNLLCAPIPYEERLISWPKAMLADLKNGEAWSNEPSMRAWTQAHRLAGFTSSRAPSAGLDGLRKQITSLRPRAVTNLENLIAAHESAGGPPVYSRRLLSMNIGGNRTVRSSSLSENGSEAAVRHSLSHCSIQPTGEFDHDIQ